MKIMRRAAIVLAVLAMAVPRDGVSAQTPDAASAEIEALQAFEGTYLLSPEESDDIEEAIDRGISDMSFITRPIAGRRLRSTNQPYQTMSIQAAGNEVATIYDGRPAIRSPRNGATVRWQREDGEVLDVSTRLQNGALIQTFVAEDGTRQNVFRLLEGGDRLDLTVTVRSERLPAPIVYTLAYRRQ